MAIQMRMFCGRDRTSEAERRRFGCALCHVRVIPGYTEWVKTAISVPDDTFEQATRQAEELGISRSEFFTRAARKYLDELSARSLTRQINDALRTSVADESGQVAAAAGRRRLADEAGW